MNLYILIDPGTAIAGFTGMGNISVLAAIAIVKVLVGWAYMFLSKTVLRVRNCDDSSKPSA